MDKKQDMAALLDSLETEATKKHDQKKAEVIAGTTASETHATSLVPMTSVTRSA